ncbi:carbohydrate kinase family protein [Maritalea porphyrae]|uniref:carbohydrate kinase family protein n=1 Tax=Maritalea porphyrae TaxID=880732 RepID=UPI0022AFEF86|nr:carbohydrate kinase family protein [Maritalea porphyrae]MCZ4271539.1 carbohydrate kinase family protein [Maritalea porphyrae]
MATPPLLVLGNVNLELILGTLSEWPEFESETIMSTSNFRAGGAAGNTALALAGLSVEHRLIAAIGNDELATWLKGEFQPSTTSWTAVQANTSVSVSILHEQGRVFLTSQGHLNAATVDTMIDAIPPATSRSSFALLTGINLMPGVTAGMSQLLTMLSTMGWTTVLDYGRPPEGWNEDTISVYRNWARASDVVIMLEDDLRTIMHSDDTDTAMNELAATLATHQILVVLRGLTRVDAVNQGKIATTTCDKFAATDTVGFGDIFNAGFLNSLMSGEGVQMAIESGLTVAKIAVTTSPRLYGVFVD